MTYKVFDDACPDIGVMSGCIIFLEKDLHITEVQQELLVGCLTFISLLGCLAAGPRKLRGARGTRAQASAAGFFFVVLV